MGDERDGGRRERHDEVLPLRERGRWRVAEDEVAEDPAAERCDHRQDRDPDDVEVAADGHQRTRDPEREQADQVEFGLHAIPSALRCRGTNAPAGVPAGRSPRGGTLASADARVTAR